MIRLTFYALLCIIFLSLSAVAEDSSGGGNNESKCLVSADPAAPNRELCPPPPGASAPVIYERGSSFEAETASSRSKAEPLTGKNKAEPPPPMTTEERKKMARDLKAIERKREEDFPKDIAREMNQIMQKMMTDPKFVESLLAEAAADPEARMLMQQLGPEFKAQMKSLQKSLKSMSRSSRSR